MPAATGSAIEPIPLRRRIGNEPSVPITLSFDFGRREARWQGAAGEDVFRANVVNGIIEIDEVATADIDRADAEADGAGVDQVKVDQSSECRRQRRHIVIAGRFQSAVRIKIGKRHPRFEEIRRATQQCAQRACVIDEGASEFASWFVEIRYSKRRGGDGLPELA